MPNTIKPDSSMTISMAMTFITSHHPHISLDLSCDDDVINYLGKQLDAKEQTTEYEYAIDDLPIRRIDALGHSLAYEYDNLCRLSRLTNENGEVWTFEYDKADNLISETRFDGYTSHYDYDKNGQLVHQTDNPNHNRAEQRHIY